MFITPWEIFDMILMIAVVGFIFMVSFRAPKKEEDILDKYLRKSSGFQWGDFWFAIMVVAPAIILHELGHKIMALSYGFSATFHAAYLWLLIAVVLRFINFPFIFFVPAFVAIAGNASYSQSALIAFMGPAVNLALFLIAIIVLKTKKRMKVKAHYFWTLTRNVNGFLLLFNMIPIPGFDGYTVFSSLWHIAGL